MLFPFLELKFASIHRAGVTTAFAVRVYLVQDGGLDARGQQVYERAILRAHTLTLTGEVSQADILAAGQAYLDACNLDEGLNLAAEQLICEL